MTAFETTIHDLLFKGIDPEQIKKDTAIYFYDTVYKYEYQYPFLMELLESQRTIKLFTKTENRDYRLSDRMLLENMREDIVYYIQEYFETNEDTVKETLLGDKWSSRIKQDLALSKIVPLNKTLNEEDIEKFYSPIFAEYDALRDRVLNEFILQNPKETFEKGLEYETEFKKAHHILFDESDFFKAFSRSFDDDKLQALLKDRVQQAMKYGQHYELVGLEDEDGEPEEEESDLAYLEARGPLADQGFTYVYELYDEYTGRRIMDAPEEDYTETMSYNPEDDTTAQSEGDNQAYWTKYEDDFNDLVVTAVRNHAETLIENLIEEKPNEWTSFCIKCKIPKESESDLDYVLDHSMDLAYQLMDFIDEKMVTLSNTLIADLLD